MSYEIRFTREAFKDVKKLSSKLQKKLHEIITSRIVNQPYAGKKLVGDLSGFFSVRLSYQDRIIYTVDEENKTIFIHRAKTHYGA